MKAKQIATLTNALAEWYRRNEDDLAENAGAYPGDNIEDCMVDACVAVYNASISAVLREREAQA